MRKIISLLFSIMGIILLMGCAEKNQEMPQQKNEQEVRSVTLTVWTPQEEQDRSHNWLFALCDGFSKEHPEWDITWKLGVCDAQAVLKTFSADPERAADVYLFTNEQLEALIDSKFVAQFGDEILSLLQTDSPKAVLDTVKGSDGGIYGLPISVDTALLYYNKSYVDEQDAAVLNRLTEKNAVAIPIDMPWVLASFYAANGGVEFIDTEEGYRFNEVEAIKSTRSIAALANNTNVVLTNDAIAQANVKAAFARSSDADKFKQLLGDDLGAALLPSTEIDGRQRSLKSFIQTTAVGVNPSCEYPQAAIEFASYLASAKAQIERYRLLGHIPASKQIYSNEQISNDAMLEIHKLVLEESAIAQPSKKAADLFNGAENWLADALLNGIVTKDNAGEITRQFIDLAD